jgi:hypothetical protein
MKTFLLLIACVLAIGCADTSTFNTSFNPLDVPMARPLTVDELHSQNIAQITGNPTKNKTNFVD